MVKAEQKEAKRLQKLRREAERTKAREEAEAERAVRFSQRQRLAEEAQKAQAQAAASTKQEADSDEPAKKRLPWRIGGVAASIAILLTIYIAARGSDLRSKLDRCESKGIITARVSYSGLFSTDTVVFDLRDGGSGGVRRIDPTHLLMQFANKLNLDSVNRVVLARNGQRRFYITGSDLRPLADSYAGGGRVWAFNNLPAKVRRMDGTRAFDEWTGGWFGVLKKQTEDVNEFITEWTGYGSIGRYSARPNYSDSTLRSQVRQTLQDVEDNVPETLQSIEANLPAIIEDMEARMMEDAEKYGLSPSEVRAQLREMEAGAREQIRGMEDEVRDQIRGMEDDVMDSLRESR